MITPKILTGAAEVARQGNMSVVTSVLHKAITDGNSGRHYRDADSSRRYNDSSGYSGHSIKDRMISRLEEMFDEAQSEHEKQIVQEWIDRLASF